MVNESRKLLVGEGVEHRTLEVIRSLIVAEAAVEKVGNLLSMYLGPEEVMLIVEIRFHTGAAIDVRGTVERIKQAIQEKYPRVERISFDTTSLG
jgi:hypothetical protein